MVIVIPSDAAWIGNEIRHFVALHWRVCPGHWIPTEVILTPSNSSSGATQNRCTSTRKSEKCLWPFFPLSAQTTGFLSATRMLAGKRWPMLAGKRWPMLAGKRWPMLAGKRWAESSSARFWRRCTRCYVGQMRLLCLRTLAHDCAHSLLHTGNSHWRGGGGGGVCTATSTQLLVFSGRWGGGGSRIITSCFYCTLLVDR